jgi:hypothetical protein
MSQVEVDKIIPQSGTTLTIGDNGDTITIPSGATLANSGIITGFESTGIDDNATGTSLTIASDGRTTLDATNEKALVVHHSDGSTVRIGMNNNATNSNEIAFAGTDFVVKPGGFEKFRIDNVGNTLINTTSAKGDDASTFAPVLTVNGGSYDGLIEIAGNRSDANGAGVARLQFIQNSNSATYKEVAEIRVETEGATANQRGGRINFRTRANGSTNTTERVRIDSSGNLLVGTTSSGTTTAGVKLRSDNSIASVIDGGTSGYFGRLTSDGDVIKIRKDTTAVGVIGTQNWGIGTSNPTPPTAYGGLHINSQYPVLKLSSTTSGTGVADGFTVRINSADDAQLWHYENKNMSFATNNTERMRISGNTVMIGKTTANIGTNGVELKTNDVARFTQTSRNVIEINRKTDDGDIVRFKKDGTTVGSIGTSGNKIFIGSFTGTNPSALKFQSQTSPVIHPCTSDGSNSDNVQTLGAASARFKDLYLGGGAFIGGTGTANKLDDYEEGLHTVTATDTGGGATITMNTSYDQLAYTKIGRVVHVQGILLFSSISGSFTGTLQISLPFTSSDLQDASGRTVLTLGTYNVDFTTGTAPYLNIGEGLAVAQIQVSNDNSSGGQGRPQGSGQLYIGGSYITDS